MSLLDNIISKAKKAINGVFFRRRINAFVESHLIDYEGKILDLKEGISNAIESNDISWAYDNFVEILRCEKRMENLNKFKEYLLKEE